MVNNSPLFLQLMLQEGRSLDAIHKQYHIHMTRHTKFPNLVQFKYDMLESPMEELLVRQCRGLILDESDNWKVIARPFDKFFNHGEVLASQINWVTATVQEKCDGSLCILYYYNDGWHVATSGRPDANGNVADLNLTFHDLFWQVFQDKGYVVPSNRTDSMYTFMFELMTPMNKVVVQHHTRDLKLIGVRHNHLGHELKPVMFASRYEPAGRYSLNSIADIQESFHKMKPIEQEGYVVVDHSFNRIKVKHPGYVTLHHMKSHFSVRYIVQLVRDAEMSEALAYFPEWEPFLLPIKQAYDALIAAIAEAYGVVKDIPVQKDFAIAIKDLPYKGVLFTLRHKPDISIAKCLQGMHIDTLVDMLRVKDTVK